MEYIIKATTTNVEWYNIEAETEEEARQYWEDNFNMLNPYDYEEDVVVVIEEDWSSPFGGRPHFCLFVNTQIYNNIITKHYEESWNFLESLKLNKLEKDITKDCKKSLKYLTK